MRDLARGIFPPLLADKGVVAALDANIRGPNARIVAEDGTSTRRFDADVDSAAYFCCLQALQNVARHAGNAPATVRFTHRADQLILEIRDEGPGFDLRTCEPGMGLNIMRDRVDALEGALALTSAPGTGTIVQVALPARALAAATG